jgi:hypothetical protein
VSFGLNSYDNLSNLKTYKKLKLKENRAQLNVPLDKKTNNLKRKRGHLLGCSAKTVFQPKFHFLQ